MKHSNKIVFNTIIQYIKVFISAIITLYTSRLVLDALDASNFGIYSLVGGVVSMLSFIQVTISTTTQRFLSYYQAKKKAWGNNVDSSDNMSLNIQNDIPNDSYFKLAETSTALSPYYPDADTYSDFFPDPNELKVDEANGCKEISTPCYVDIYEYH